MIKNKLAIADRYLQEIKFLIDKQGCSLELIDRAFYWVGPNGDESSCSVSNKIMNTLVSNQIFSTHLSRGMMLATPVYMLAIGSDPRKKLKDVCNPNMHERNIIRLTFSMYGIFDLGPWEGYMKVW